MLFGMQRHSLLLIHGTRIESRGYQVFPHSAVKSILVSAYTNRKSFTHKSSVYCEARIVLQRANFGRPADESTDAAQGRRRWDGHFFSKASAAS